MEQCLTGEAGKDDRVCYGEVCTYRTADYLVVWKAVVMTNTSITAEASAATGPGRVRSGVVFMRAGVADRNCAFSSESSRRSHSYLSQHI